MANGPFKTISGIKQANSALPFGGHFFDADTMKFFDSRVESEVYGGRYFITSEQFHFRGETFARRYTLRRAEDDGQVKTAFGTWQEYKTLEDATRAAITAATDVGTAQR